MQRLLFRQPVNYWQSMSVMYRIQTILALGLVSTYFTTRSMDQFRQWVETYQASYSGLSALLLILFVSALAISTPFILIYLIPRQKTLKIFQDKPLTKLQLLELIGFYTLKYQIVIMLAIFPISIAMIIIRPLPGITLLLSNILVLLIIPILNILFLAIIQKKRLYLWGHFFGLTVFWALFAVFYWIYPFPWPFIFSILIFMGITCFLFYSKAKEETLREIFRFNQAGKRYREWHKYRLKNIPKFLPEQMQVLFNREWISLWRNPRFIRLKIFTLLAQIIASFFIIIYDYENSVVYLSLLSAVLIWLHYGGYFSDNFAQADTSWFINILPLKFIHFFAAKFIAEFIYILIILVILLPFLFASGIEASAIFQVVLLLLSYSAVVLITMINFQMIFHENPRYAGYAYHFSVVFFVIMAINYRFVGPIMALFMIFYTFYMNYRYFKA